MGDSGLRFLYDFHVHTERSEDGTVRIKDIEKMLSLTGLEAIGITDHDRFFNEDMEGIIAGQEKTCRDGTHIIGLFVIRELLSCDPEELFKEIRSQGGIVCIPHLFRKETGLFANADYKKAMKLVKMADAMEVYNSKSNEAENKASLKIWRENRDLIPLSVSDAHFLFEVGNGAIASGRRITNSEELKRAYRQDELQLLKCTSHKKKAGYAENMLKKVLSVSPSLFNTVRAAKHRLKTNVSFILKDRKKNEYEELLRIEK